MPHLSKNKLDKHTEEKLIHTLNETLTHIEKSSDMFSFLSNLLTDTERLMLAKRLAIIVLLEEGFPDSYIATVLHVTRVTVGRIRYFNEARGEGFAVALNTLKKIEQFEQFKKMLISLAKFPYKATGKLPPDPFI